DQIQFPLDTQASKKLFANPIVWNKSIIEFAPARISFAIVTSRPSAICQGDETSAVKIHRVPGEPAADPCERQIEKRTFRIAINCADQTQIVTADIEKQRGQHQLGVPHVVLFIFVQPLEPGAVSDGKLLVVMAKALRHISPRKTARQ